VLPVPGKALAHNNPGGRYTVPKVVQQCDKLITVAPLQTDASSGVSLSVKNYLAAIFLSVLSFKSAKAEILGHLQQRNPVSYVVDLVACYLCSQLHLIDLSIYLY